MSLSDDERKLASFLAERLERCAEQIVSEWVGWIRSRLSNPAVESLSVHGLLDHIPPVIHHLGHYVINPTYAVRDEMLSHLRLHGQTRRDQGYAVRDLMAELDGLSHLIMRRMQAETVGSDESYGLDAALTVFGRLSAGLRAMAFVAVGVYGDTAQDRQQELARRLAEFGRTIGHELRSPLNSVALSIEVLENPEFSADEARRRQQFDVIRSALKHADGLLYDIDLLSMAESARTTSHMSPLNRVLEAVRDELSARARSRGVTLDFATDVPRLVVETVVAQIVLTNLVNNAIKYSDPSKKERWVRIEARQVPAEDSLFVELEVSDNGLGILKDFHHRVFQRHFRAHAEVAEGTGLGLAITQELVVERGGTIELDSEPGKGTTVRVGVRALDVDSVGAYTRGHGSEGLMYSSVRELLETNAPPASGDQRDDE